MQKLVENLRHKLGIFTENATSPTDPDVTESWRTICSLEAECVFCFFFFYVKPLRSSPVLGSCRELKGESYGIELLHAVGFVYSAKAKQFLASNQTFFGVGGWLHNVQGKYHVFSETCVWWHHFLCLVSLADAVQCVDSAVGNRAQGRVRPDPTG